MLGLLSPFISPVLSTIPSYFGVALPLTWVISILLLIVSLFLDQKMIKPLLVFSVIGLFFMPRFYSLGGVNSGETQLNITSLNIRGGKSITDTKHQIKEADISVLKSISENTEILCLQEVNTRVTDWINENNINFKHQLRIGNKGTFIGSNLPVINSGEIDFGTRVNSCLWADIQTANGTVRIYNVHFQSNRIYEDTEKAIAEGKDYNPDIFNSFQNIFLKYKKYSTKRVYQAQMLVDHMQECPYPIIVSGDFNEAPMSYLYQKLKGNLLDGFKNAKGLGGTYPESQPIVRIDYIFHSKKITCHNFQILRNISLSDHLPIVASFGIREQ